MDDNGAIGGILFGMAITFGPIFAIYLIGRVIEFFSEHEWKPKTKK